MKMVVLGSDGLVGASLMRTIKSHEIDLIGVGRSRADLTDPEAVRDLLLGEKPDWVVLAAAKVGGIRANMEHPVSLLNDNLRITLSVLEAIFQLGNCGLVYIGSACSYPKLAEQPIKEDLLLRGPLEVTNESYALSKIVGMKLCEAYNREHHTDFRILMSTNLYGPEDRFGSDASHVIPALVTKFHTAKIKAEKVVEVWGSGQVFRDFLYVDDLSRAIELVLSITKSQWSNTVASPTCSHVNVGSGSEVSIASIAEIIRNIVGFRGKIHFDESKPDGMKRRILDNSRINSLGWRPAFSLEEGIRKTYRAYLATQALE